MVAPAAIRFFKVTALPARLVPNGIYLVKVAAGFFNIVIADAAGAPLQQRAGGGGSRAFAMMLAG